MINQQTQSYNVSVYKGVKYNLISFKSCGNNVIECPKLLIEMNTL